MAPSPPQDSGNPPAPQPTEPFPSLSVTTSPETSTTEPFPSLDLTASPEALHGDASPPPAYGSHYGQIQSSNDGIGTKADLQDTGRINIRIDQRTRGLSSLLVPAMRSQLDLSKIAGPSPPPYVPPSLETYPRSRHPPPRLNIVIQVVGSRGDVQPFVALGKVLKETHNHRVRLATHPVFQSFVEENGLEFFSIAGDPAELMAFMVKNPGLMPGFDTLRSGDVGKRRREIAHMINRCWRSCIEPGQGFGIEASDSNVEEWLASQESDTSGEQNKPFVADAIIANPPSFAHIHCAEKLGVPLHMMFTMPWSPTQSFPHPLANITSSNADASITNFVSYALVDMMTWQGLGDVINRFRQKVLGLEPISPTWAPGMLARMRVPWTYCWSPALIPKPRDWGAHISISGFYFLSLGSNYVPNPDLAAFLDAGPPPVYIGFGSIVVDDPDAMTKMIFDAVKKSGQRALVSKGWGGFGAEQIGIPDGVFMLGNVPHDWLFQRVSCVVHHGGAGTTAAGISCGRPTIVVPFFGDQPFWGAMVARADAGPAPIPYKQLTADKLAEAILQAIKPEFLDKAKELSNKISRETGTQTGADSFHNQLDVDKLRCTLCPNRTAVWRIKRTEVRLSAFAVAVLCRENLLKLSDLKLYRAQEHHTEDEPFDPISGGASALVETMGSMAMGIADMPVSALKSLKIHPDSTRARSRSNSKKDKNDTQRKPSEQSSLSPPPPRTPETSPARSATPTSPRAAVEIVNDMTLSAKQDKGQSSRSSLSPARSPPPADAHASPKFSMEDAITTGKGLSRIVGAGIKSPMDFTLALARGFHNAPKIYGDESVRKSEKITGFSSGLKAAGKGFGYGFYDGISGLVTQPIEGAKKDGVEGFIKGVGMGLGGIVFKPGAAIWGLPGYTSAGIYKELKKRFGPSADSWITISRTAQGLDEYENNSTPEARAAVVQGWKDLKPYIRKKKNLADEGREHIHDIRARSRSTITRARALSPAFKGNSPEIAGIARTPTNMTEGSSVWSPVSEGDRPILSRNQSATGSAKLSLYDPEDPELEAAIKRSVADTSAGNPEEDAAIENAIRASLAELESQRVQGADESELQRAMESSLEKAHGGLHPPEAEYSDSGFLSENEEHGHDDEQEQLESAMRESEKMYSQQMAEDQKAKQEEEIVMQYMMKQSLVEEEMKKKKAEEQK